MILAEPLRAARAGKLALPGSPEFNASSWTVGSGDLTLMESVIWFDRQLRAAWADVARLRLDRLDRGRLVEELCGRCNYTFVYSDVALDEARDNAEPGTLPMGSIAHLLFRTPAGDAGTADALRTGATDTLGRALRYLEGLPPSKRAPFGVAARAADAFSVFNRIYVLEYYLQRSVWQDWRVEPLGNDWRLMPPMPDPFGASTIAVDWRREQAIAEWQLVAGKAWSEGRGWPETIVDDTRRPGRKRFVTTIRMPGDGEIPIENVLRWDIEGSDLEAVKHKPLPGFAPHVVTLEDLIDTALLFGSAARSMLSATIQHLGGSRTKPFAPSVDADALVGLRAGFGWSDERARAVVDFFTYRGKAFDGVWSKPLVRMPTGALLPIFSAIVGPNLYRSAEIWLAEAGGKDIQKSRGTAFEEQTRRNLRDAVGKARLDVTVAPLWSVKIDGGRRDIDLAIRIGRTVFIGDAKLKRFPAGPKEASRWETELVKGAAQAQVRCRFLKGQPSSAAQQTKWTGAASDLQFEPFVLVSGYFGAGTAVAGVPIIDAEGLQEFFDPGIFGAWGELRPNSELHATLSVPLHLPDEDLAMAFRAYLDDPVRIRAIERAMQLLPRQIGFPADDGNAIVVAEPMVDHRRFTDGPTLYEDVLAYWNRTRKRWGLREIGSSPQLP